MVEATSWQKEQLSRALLHAVATQRGYTIASWNVDKDGVDATLNDHGVMVDIQLKCTHSPRISGENYAYDLDVNTYDKLRKAERSAPGYLVLVIAPSEVAHWLSHEPERVLLFCHAYWARIQDQPGAPGNHTVAIRLPPHQYLDAEALDGMFQLARDRLFSGVGQGEAA